MPQHLRADQANARALPLNSADTDNSHAPFESLLFFHRFHRDHAVGTAHQQFDAAVFGYRLIPKQLLYWLLPIRWLGPGSLVFYLCRFQLQPVIIQVQMCCPGWRRQKLGQLHNQTGIYVSLLSVPTYPAAVYVMHQARSGLCPVHRVAVSRQSHPNQPRSQHCAHLGGLQARKQPQDQPSPGQSIANRPVPSYLQAGPVSASPYLVDQLAHLSAFVRHERWSAPYLLLKQVWLDPAVRPNQQV